MQELITLAPSEGMGENEKDCAGTRVESALARHDLALRRFLARALRPGEEAEDVLQEVYVRLLNQERNDAVDGYPKTYLFVTATNIIKDLRRRRQVRERAGNDPLLPIAARSELSDPSPSIESALVWRQGIEIVQESLRALKPDYIVVFLLRWRDGLTFPEISRQTGIPVRTAERYASHALAHCRRSLEKKDWRI